jgi:hypothetical protein
MIRVKDVGARFFLLILGSDSTKLYVLLITKILILQFSSFGENAVSPMASYVRHYMQRAV